MRIPTKTIVCAIVGLAIGLLFRPAHAASPKDVEQVVAMIRDLDVPMASRSGNEMAFVHKKMRYTFWYPADRSKENGWLSVWVRRDGSRGQASLDTFSDHGYQGVADFGIDGGKSMFFNSGKDGSPARGSEHAEYWQKRYDAAIKAALEYKHRFKK